MSSAAQRIGRGFVLLLVLGLLLTGTSLIAPAAIAGPATAGAAPTNLTLGQLPDPVDTENLTGPSFGWEVGAGAQAAYQIQVATSSADIAGAGVWDSGKVDSSANGNVKYDGPALATTDGYYWRVRTWGSDDTASAWSAVSHFGTGPGSSWSDASPIWTPGVESGWTDYTYEGTFNISAVAASVNFRAKDSTNFYMWQFRAATAPTDPNTLKVHANVNGSYGVLSVQNLPFALNTGTDYNYRIVVDGTSISSYLKPASESTWSFVNTTDDSSFTAGGIGFRTGSTESAYYDDLKVTDPTGKVLYSNDFADSANADFTCGTVSAGRLLIGTSKNCNYGVDWQNYTTEATVNITQGTAGLSLKGTSTTSFYLWQLKVGSPGVLQINKNVGGTFTTLKTVNLSKAIATGTDYVLKVVALGNTYKTYVDGVLVDTLTDATYSTGRVGVRTGGFESFVLKNLTVTTPDGTVFYANTFPSRNTDFSCGTIGSNSLNVPINANCLVAAPSTNWAFLRGQTDLAAGKDVAWAHLFATGASTNPGRQFVYKMWLNGEYVGIGPTRPIGTETRYDGYDVTDLVHEGAANTIGVLVYTTSDQRFLAKLVVRYTDGTTQTFGTGPSWRAFNGSAVLPDGGSIGTSYYAAPKENFNAALYPFGFDQPGYDDSTWRVPVVKAAFADLVATPTAKVERQLRTPVSVVEKSPGNYFVDYGRTWVGGLSMDVTGTAGQVLDIRYGEIPSGTDTVKYATSGGNNYQDKWTLKAGTQHLETWGMRVFRYAEVLGAPTGLGKDDFKAMAYVYPYDAEAGVFHSSDENLNKVWALAHNTIEATNGNLYVDSWERERGAYEADSYLQMMSNFYTSADPTLGNYSIDYLFKQRTWPTEWPIYIILAMHDSYQQTGDIATIGKRYADLQAKLPNGWFEGSTGLIRKNNGSNGAGSCTDCDIVDWPTSERDGFVFKPYNTVINAISYRAYADMAEIASALGKTDDAQTYGQRAATIKAAVNDRMWDASKGAYRDGLNADGTPIDHWASQASVFATAFGLASDSQAAAVAAYIGPRGMVCSVYCAAFLFEALYNGDRADLAYDLLTSTGTRSYLNMINKGAGATMEAWDLSLKSNTTYSHPWAASPAYAMPQGLFGIKPTTAGYATFDVKPQPDSLAWADVTVPTLKGRIGAAFDTVDSRVDVGVYVPPNTRARVYVPGVDESTSSVYVDGYRNDVVHENGYARVDNVAPGCHVFSTVSTSEPAQNTRLTGVCADGYSAPDDVTAPVVTATVDPAAPSGQNGWYAGSATVALAATDDMSGVDRVEYKVGSDDWATYAAPIDAPEGVTRYDFRAFDIAGNASEVGHVTVSRDVTAPTAAADFDDQDGTADGPVEVTLTGADSGSGIDALTYSLDGGAWTTYTAPVRVTGGGAHQLSYLATDKAGNQSETGTATITLRGPDTVAPVVQATTDPEQPTGAAGWFVDPVDLVLSATDDRSGVDSVEYRLGDGEWTTYASPVALLTGTTQVRYRATDGKGNTSEPGSLVVRRDQDAPSTVTTFDDENGATDGPVDVGVEAADATSGVASLVYRLDGGGWAPYTGAVSVSGAGEHAFEAQATDHAGNVSVVETTTVRIAQPDTVPPVVTATTDPVAATGEAGWFTGAVSVVLDAVDDRHAVTLVEYALNGSDWRTYDAPFAVPEGINEVSYRATDSKGNVSDPGVVTVRRDVTAPSSAASFDDQGGQSTGPVAVTLVATDATSGVDRIRYSVDGGPTKTYAGAFDVTGSGATIAFHSVDKAGNVEETRTAVVRITPDHNAPVVTATVSPGQPSGADGWYSGDVSVTLTATDDRSGVASLQYRTAGGEWADYQVPLTPAAGRTTYEFRATDGKGNVSEVGSVTIKRDYTAPTSQLVSAGDHPATVTLSASDDVSGVRSISYRVDSGAWTTYAGPFEIAEPGEHVVQLAATDNAGNLEVTNSRTVLVGADTTAPVLQVATDPTGPNGSAGWFRTAPRLIATATDVSGIGSVEYRVGASAWKAYTGAVTAPTGSTTYGFRATDTKGNASAVTTTSVRFDGVAPVSRAVFDDAHGTGTTAVKVTLASTDATSGVASVRYQVDGGSWKPYAGAFRVAGAGRHAVAFAATDVAGNVERAKTVTLRIAATDTTGPSVSVRTNPASPTGTLGWFTGRVRLVASATDPSGVRSVQYRVGAGRWHRYTRPVVLAQGVRKVSVRATDTKGNVSRLRVVTVKRDSSAPVVAAHYADRAGQTRSPVKVRIVARDRVSGVRAIYVSLDGGAWSRYSGPVTVRGAGSHVVRYTAYDKAGNKARAKTAKVRIAR